MQSIVKLGLISFSLSIVILLTANLLSLSIVDHPLRILTPFLGNSVESGEKISFVGIIIFLVIAFWGMSFLKKDS